MSSRYNFLSPDKVNTEDYFMDLGLSYDSPFMRIRRPFLWDSAKKKVHGQKDLATSLSINSPLISKNSQKL